MQAMQDRQKRIADGLASAERGVREQELAKAKSAQMLKEAKQQATDIVAQAHKRANEIIEQSKQEARAEGRKPGPRATASSSPPRPRSSRRSIAPANSFAIKSSISLWPVPARFSSARSTKRLTPLCWMT